MANPSKISEVEKTDSTERQFSGSAHVDKHRPATDRVRARAYEIYEQRGGDEGHDLEDWTQAERELGTERE